MTTKNFPSLFPFLFRTLSVSYFGFKLFSFLHFSDIFDIASAAFQIVKGQPFPIDLCSIQSNNHRIFAFLSLTWGIISDIDIESERFRLLGNARFTVGAVYRILALRIYEGRISYLPCEDEGAFCQDSISSRCPILNNELHSIRDGVENEKDDDTLNLTANSAEEPSFDNGLQQDEVERSSTERKKSPKVTNVKSRHFSVTSGIFRRKSSNKYDTIDESKEHVSFEDDELKQPPFDETPADSQRRARRAFSTTEYEINHHSNNAAREDVRYPKRPVYGPVDSLLPKIDDALSGNWVKCDGQFVTVIIMLISHLGSNLFTCPDLKLGDGNMEILFAKKGISRKALIDVLTKMETGNHVGIRDLEIRRIRAFRLEPGFEREGYLAVDGEPIDYTSVQGQIHKGLGRVFLCS